MIKKKAMKGITAVLLLVFSVGILAGCSEPQSSEPQSNEAVDSTPYAVEPAPIDQQMDESDKRVIMLILRAEQRVIVQEVNLKLQRVVDYDVAEKNI